MKISFKEKILYVYEHAGIRYTIYDRTPKIGELSCTWHASKKKHLIERPLPLSVFSFDENCAAASEEYDFRVVKTETI